MNPPDLRTAARHRPCLGLAAAAPVSCRVALGSPHRGCEIREEAAQCFVAQRNLATLNDKPWTHEWLHAALRLIQAQPQPEPMEALLSAFQVGSAGYERLLRAADDADVVAKFRAMEQLKRRSAVQYEQQTGASRRLLELVCTSEVIRLRSRRERSTG